MDITTLEVKASELRTAINEAAAREDADAADLDNLRAEYGTVEARIRALKTVADAAPSPSETETREIDTEDRELRSIMDRARVGNYVAAAMEMRSVDGAEAELNAGLGIGRTSLPLELLAEDIETRQTTDVESTVRPSRWLDRLFSDTAASRIGITFDSVAPGVSSHPVTTAGPDPVQRGRTEAVSDGAWSVGVTEIKPSRNAARLVFSIEDAARMPGLEDALRRDMRMALTEKIDRTVFLGDDGANEANADITGLNSAAITEKTIKQADKVKGPETLKEFLDLVDGKHAASLGDLNVVASIGANALWGSTVANAQAENQTVAQFLRANGLSWGVRGDIEAATTSGKMGAFIGRARGINGAGVAAVWSGAELIRDPYTGAAKGEVALTLNYLWGFELPRASNFARVKFVA